MTAATVTDPVVKDGSQHHNGVMVALRIPEEVGSLVALENGVPVEEMHITLAYLGDIKELDPGDPERILTAAQKTAAEWAPLSGKFPQGWGVFSAGDDGLPLWAHPDVPGISTMREALVDKLSGEGVGELVASDHSFSPHVTLAYYQSPDDIPIASVQEMTNEPHDLVFPDLMVAVGDDVQYVPFSGTHIALTAAADAPVASKDTTLLNPDTTDIAPIYFALVDDVDKQAVLDVLALVPATSENSQPIVYSRGPNQSWVLDEAMRTALLSTSPPPVVSLDAELAKNVIEQVDGFFTREDDNQKADTSTRSSETAVQAFDPYGDLQLYSTFGDLFPVPTEAELAAMTAANTRPGDGAIAAERLRRYWTTGKGGAKIRWGTGGDWKRCVKHLTKYLGPGAKGYCQNLHKRATGIYTSTHAKLVRDGKRGRIRASGAEEGFEPVNDQHRFAVINASLNRAFTAAGGLEEISVTDVAPVDAPEHGARFRIPMVIPEGIETGDGRQFVPMSVTTRELPIPLLWQLKTADGHDGSVVVGRIDQIERIEGGLGNAVGVFDVGPYGQEVERLVRGKYLRGVSADLDEFEATASAPNKTIVVVNDGDSGTTTSEQEIGDAPQFTRIGGEKMLIDKARVTAITVVAKPAFEECTIELIPEETS